VYRQNNVRVASSSSVRVASSRSVRVASYLSGEYISTIGAAVFEFTASLCPPGCHFILRVFTNIHQRSCSHDFVVLLGIWSLIFGPVSLGSNAHIGMEMVDRIIYNPNYLLCYFVANYFTRIATLPRIYWTKRKSPRTTK
jgi:hypothetical protein